MHTIIGELLRARNMGNLFRGVQEVFPNNEEECLTRYSDKIGRPLRVKLGIDPTGADLHLGHSVLLRKLRQFQDAGHIAVLIIGDFTARIGDPTGKSEVRKQLTEEQVAANAETYLKQVRPILDFDTPERLEVRYNSEWLSKLDLSQTLKLLSTMTVGQMLAKEEFAQRHKKGSAIFLHEFLYPMMQGFDSVAVQADVELGGTDQKFNIAIGRDLQRHFGQAPQFGMLMPILTGTDGIQKMSKSLGNYVGLSEDALSMYSKLEKTPDNLVPWYFELLTDLPLSLIPPGARDRQKRLAMEVVRQYYGTMDALKAQMAAGDLIRGNSVETDIIPEFSLGYTEFPIRIDILLRGVGLCEAANQGKREVLGGAVRLDGEKITQVDLTFESPDELIGKVMTIGKNKFMRFIP